MGFEIEEFLAARRFPWGSSTFLGAARLSVASGSSILRSAGFWWTSSIGWLWAKGWVLPFGGSSSWEIDRDLEQLGGSCLSGFGYGSGLLEVLSAGNTDEGEALSVSEVPNLSRSHVSEPLLGLGGEVAGAIIHTGSSYEEAFRNVLPNEAVKCSRACVGVKRLGSLDGATLGVENDEMQSSVVIVLVGLNLNLASVQHDLGEVTSFEASRLGLDDQHELLKVRRQFGDVQVLARCLVHSITRLCLFALSIGELRIISLSVNILIHHLPTIPKLVEML